MTDKVQTKPPVSPVSPDGGIHPHNLTAEDILTEMRRQTYLLCAKTLTTLEAGVAAGEVEYLEEAEVLEFMRQMIMTLRDPIKPGR